MTEMTHEIKPEGIADEVPQFVPSVHIEVSKEQLDILEVGKDVVITLKGKVKSLSAGEFAESDNNYSISMELSAVSINPKDNEFGELADD